jgi:hypothetical protein
LQAAFNELSLRMLQQKTEQMFSEKLPSGFLLLLSFISCYEGSMNALMFNIELFFLSAEY